MSVARLDLSEGWLQDTNTINIPITGLYDSRVYDVTLELEEANGLILLKGVVYSALGYEILPGEKIIKINVQEKENLNVRKQ